jgi:hypothetical protein
MAITPDTYIVRLVPDQGGVKDDLHSLVRAFADVAIIEDGRRALTIECDDVTKAALQQGIDKNYSGQIEIDPYEGLKLI